MPKTTVVVGLGSNKNSLQHLRQAVHELKQIAHFKIIKLSSIYESDAQMQNGSPKSWDLKYLNAAVLIEVTDFEPQVFLSELKNIEKKMGRKNDERWAPREIDLDILYAANIKIESDSLNIPHKSLSERPFALLPALEVCDHLKNDISIEKPVWCNEWSSQKPFNTQKSRDQFWPRFVGILNVTTDSFSDGNIYLSEESFKTKALSLIQAGATVLDIGAESTRPNAQSISAELEHERLSQAIDWLSQINAKCEISIDCRNPDVLNKIINQYEVHFLNDVTGFENPQMLKILKSTKVPAVVMHSITIPPNQKQILNQTVNPNQQLLEWWKNKIQIFKENDIDIKRLIFDPGIGFGKTAEQSAYILNHLEELSVIKNDVYLGFSRKSFLQQYTHSEAKDRDLASAAQLLKTNLLYCQYLRTHDVESAKTVLRMSV